MYINLLKYFIINIFKIKMSQKQLKSLARDIKYLGQNKIPQESSGLKIHKLDYAADSSDEENTVRLQDDHIQELSEALCKNDVFTGPLDLSNNDLTDLSTLYLKDAIGKVGGVNITKLNLSGNKNLQGKTGIFIGDALI